MKVSGYLSKYLKADDLLKPQLMTIERVDEEEVGEDDKLVVYFTEEQRGVVLRPTTIAQVVEAIGEDDTDNWIGHPIVIYNDPNVMFGKRKTGGIRFRKPKGHHVRKVIKAHPTTHESANPDESANPAIDDLPF